MGLGHQVASLICQFCPFPPVSSLFSISVSHVFPSQWKGLTGFECPHPEKKKQKKSERRPEASLSPWSRSAETGLISQPVNSSNVSSDWHSHVSVTPLLREHAGDEAEATSYGFNTGMNTKESDTFIIHLLTDFHRFSRFVFKWMLQDTVYGLFIYHYYSVPFPLQDQEVLSKKTL